MNKQSLFPGDPGERGKHTIVLGIPGAGKTVELGLFAEAQAEEAQKSLADVEPMPEDAEKKQQ